MDISLQIYKRDLYPYNYYYIVFSGRDVINKLKKYIYHKYNAFLKEFFFTGKRPRQSTVIKHANEIIVTGEKENGIKFAKKHAKYAQINSINLLLANVSVDDQSVWLAHTNNYLENMNVGLIELSCGKKPLFSKIQSCESNDYIDGELVSIIMPVYNAGRFIEYSVRSVLNQSWVNLELIIIDDCSTDSTWDILTTLGNSDSRIKLIKNKFNVGPYVSKNYGLLVSKGSFITGHDADDFAFYNRIELQMEYMKNNPKVKASTANKIRVSGDGTFINFHSATNNYDDGAANKAFVSCIFERSFLVNKLGFWDCVRFGADSEIIGRAKILLGENFHETNQLSMLCLDDENSLTNNDIYGISKISGLSPPRRLYLDNFKKWHLGLATDDCYMDFPPLKRPFDIMDISNIDFSLIYDNNGFNKYAKNNRKNT